MPQNSASVHEITPEYSEEELQELIGLHGEMLDLGFTGCEVRLPTKRWHGVGIEAFVDLETEGELPFVKASQDAGKLAVYTLSGVGFEVGVVPSDKLPSIFDRSTLPIKIDSEIEDRMTRMAEIGRNLAYEGLGFPDELPWIQPMEKVDPPVVLCTNNPGRRYKERVSKDSDKRQGFWKEKGWTYAVDWPTKDRPEPAVKLLRYVVYNPDENSLDNVLLSIRCNPEGDITAMLHPDFGPSKKVNPRDFLALDDTEIAQLQVDMGEELESGLLSARYIELTQPKK